MVRAANLKNQFCTICMTNGAKFCTLLGDNIINATTSNITNTNTNTNKNKNLMILIPLSI